jgi:hypothetical protein
VEDDDLCDAEDALDDDEDSCSCDEDVVPYATLDSLKGLEYRQKDSMLLACLHIRRAVAAEEDLLVLEVVWVELQHLLLMLRFSFAFWVDLVLAEVDSLLVAENQVDA